MKLVKFAQWWRLNLSPLALMVKLMNGRDSHD